MILLGSKYVKGHGESSAASVSAPPGVGLLMVETASFKLLEAVGYFPVDLGPLDVGGPLLSLPSGSLSGASFIKA